MPRAPTTRPVLDRLLRAMHEARDARQCREILLLWMDAEHMGRGLAEMLADLVLAAHLHAERTGEPRPWDLPAETQFAFVNKTWPRLDKAGRGLLYLLATAIDSMKSRKKTT